MPKKMHLDDLLDSDSEDWFKIKFKTTLITIINAHFICLRLIENYITLRTFTELFTKTYFCPINFYEFDLGKFFLSG